jgi:RNase P subunit RPR2
VKHTAIQDRLTRPICDTCAKPMQLVRIETWREDHHHHSKYAWRCQQCGHMKYERT